MAVNRKPPGEAINPRNGKRLQLIPVSREKLPDAPDGLLAPTRELWASYWNDAVSGLVQPSDIGLVERWIRYADEWARAMTAFRKERLVEGSMGQPRLNPLSTYISQLESAIEKAEDRLGLNPKARLALGVQLGEAKKTLADLNSDLEDDADEYVELQVINVDPDTGTEGRSVD